MEENCEVYVRPAIQKLSRLFSLPRLPGSYANFLRPECPTLFTPIYIQLEDELRSISFNCMALYGLLLSILCEWIVLATHAMLQR
jgi:hypothetical protein